MIKGIKVLILLLLVSQGNLFSQQLSHQVLVPAAGISFHGESSYSQTIGETAIEIIGVLRILFLPRDFSSQVLNILKRITPAGNGVKVYPNPVTDYLYVELFGACSQEIQN